MPVALTLLGIGAFPQSHPLCLGMMGMHGEAVVNTAIQQADLLLAFGMRFDDRVTGNLKTYAPHAKKIHVEIDPSEIGKNVKVDVAIVADLLPALKALHAAGRRQAPRDLDGRGRALAQGHAGARHPPARDSRPDRGAGDARHLARHRGQRGDRQRRGPAPDVGGAVLQARRAAHADHLGRPGHHGLRAAGGDRRQVRAARRRGLGDRRRRRLPDDRSASWRR